MNTNIDIYINKTGHAVRDSFIKIYHDLNNKRYAFLNYDDMIKLKDIIENTTKEIRDAEKQHG